MVTSESRHMDANFRVLSAELTVDGLNFHACLDCDDTYRLTLDGDYRGTYGSYECAVEAAQHFADKMILGKNFRLNEELKRLRSENAALKEKNAELQSQLLLKCTYSHGKALVHGKAWDAGDASWRGGALWFSAENQALLEVFEKGLPIADIAKIHRRTENAILCRLKYLGIIEEGPRGVWYRVGTEIYNGEG